MTRAQIEKIKDQLLLSWGAQLSRLQYHPVTDEISAYGKNLSARHARGNIDRHGYGRYTVAQMDAQGKWRTVHGEDL